jgi:uncharacterized protein YjbI with pentapeptide repeats
MANSEHLQILKQGVAAWNAWRIENNNITPDLTHTDLHEAHLAGADLRKADLLNANLYSADLRKADLRDARLLYANVYNANLSGANLTGADLFSANLSEAFLHDANLHGADLTNANLHGADLARADVSEAILWETVFGNINLSTVRGLETCRHEGPSILDHRTLAQSGPLPLAFLRGCGLPDTLIDYLPSLLNQPFQFYSCFISYASKDRAFAERLYADLQNKGVRCWFAPEDMKIGDRIRPRIDETIRVYDKLLLVLSKTSVGSQWVEEEVEIALARERQQKTTILFPVRIDNTVMTLKTGWPAHICNTRHIGDFRRWKTHGVYQKAFDRLLRDLKAAEKQPEGARPDTVGQPPSKF